MESHLGGRVVNGEPIFWEGDRFRYLAFLEKNEGKVFQMLLATHRPKRTTNQNRYLFGVVYKNLSETTGHTPEEMHEYCKVEFNPIRLSIAGQEKIIGGSTTNLDTLQFQEYVGKIQRWAAEFLNCVIPDPNQTEWIGGADDEAL